MKNNNLIPSRISNHAVRFGLLLLSVSFVTGFLPYASSVLNHGGSPYQTGDWLINYAGGFVRRGMTGQIILWLFPDGRAGLGILLVIQSGLYLCVFAYFGYVLLKSTQSWAETILICSPAGICFYGWDLAAFGRKEVIGYFVMVVLSLRIPKKESVMTARVLATFSLLTYAIGILSWEPLALFLPFILLLLRLGFSSRSSIVEQYLIQVSFTAVAGVGFLVSILNKGTPDIATSICSAVRANGFVSEELCSGSIDAIGWTSLDSIQAVRNSFPNYFWYLPLFALALFPIVYSGVVRGFAKFSLISFLVISPLFLVTDYGRWFSMYYVALLFVLVALRRLKIDQGGILTSGKFAVLFLTSWGIPHWAASWERFPLRGAVVTPIQTFINCLPTSKILYGAVLVILVASYKLIASERLVNKVQSINKKKENILWS